MMDHEHRSDAQDTTDRLRRLETKLTRLSLALGIDPARPDRVQVKHYSGSRRRVEISDLSVSLGAIQAACRTAGLAAGEYSVVMGDKAIGQFFFTV